MPLTIAIDYDDTFTADPGLWRQFIDSAQGRGHRVVVISSRTNSADNHKEIWDAIGDNRVTGVAVILTGGKSKRSAISALPQAAFRIEKIDIWIDDLPESISMPAAEAVNRVYLQGKTGD